MSAVSTFLAEARRGEPQISRNLSLRVGDRQEIPIPVSGMEVGRWKPRVSSAEAVLKASSAAIRHDQADRAFYRPGTDRIHLPPRSSFEIADTFFATALHELARSTGQPSRLDRDLAHPFGGVGYAKEELRAEVASRIIGDRLGMGHDPDQHSVYVKCWFQVPRENPKEILRAARDADKITGYALAPE